MMRNASIAALGALSLAACAAPAYVSPVEVTRFVGTQPQQLGTGSVSIRAATGIDPQSLEFSFFESAVAAELAQLGYTVVEGDAPQIAVIDVERFTATAGGGRNPVSVGVGGGAGNYGSGVGVGVGFDLSGPPAERIETQLRVMIQPGAGGTALWEGRAHITATSNSDMADTRAVATKLADALFTGFPGQSGATIKVK